MGEDNAVQIGGVTTYSDSKDDGPMSSIPARAYQRIRTMEKMEENDDRVDVQRCSLFNLPQVNARRYRK